MRHHHPNFLDVPLANSGVVHYGRILSSSSSSTTTSSYVPPLTLDQREEVTRLQLQKQKLKEQHHAVVLEQSIPGYRTSAAFFASLRTNLRLNASPPDSPVSTPPSMRASTGTLPPPSPLSTPAELGSNMDPANDNLATPAPSSLEEDPLADVPALTTYVTTSDDEKRAALRLIADSIAQMRQIANNSLIFHPLHLAVLVAVLSLVIRVMTGRGHDAFITATTCTGVIMIELVVVRYLTQEYLWTAEAVQWNWLDNADVVVTKFGDEVIGTCVVEWVSGEGRQKRKKAWRGEIIAWTVRLKYRRKGVGTAVLEEAVKHSRTKSAEALEFAEEHANSKRILPRFYNGKFDKGEKMARETLQDLLESSPTRTRKKRGNSS